MGIKLDGDVWYKLIVGEEYASYGFNPDPNRTEPNADDIARWIMIFEKEIFGNSDFKISDPRLFDSQWPDSIVKPSSYRLGVVFYISPANCNIYIAVITILLPGGGSIEFEFHEFSGMCDPIESGGIGGPIGWGPFPPGGAGGGVIISSPNPTEVICPRGWFRMVPEDPGYPNGPTIPSPCPLEDPEISNITAEPDPNITCCTSDLEWDDNTTVYPPQALPTWANMTANFPKAPDGSEMCAAAVYTLVGGDVLGMLTTNPNACALRISRALNYSGVVIPNIPGQTWKGSDGKYYFLGVPQINKWMKKIFPPNSSTTFTAAQLGPNGANFYTLVNSKKGIYLMRANDESATTGFGATGHVSLINTGLGMRNKCVAGHPTDGLYFNCRGGVKSITIWELP